MRALILTTLVASMVVATASQARDSAEDITTVKNVTFKDLDLNTPSGLRQLHRRIASATDAVCGSYSATEHHDDKSMKQCRDDAAKQVNSQVARIRESMNPKMSANARH